MHSVTYKWMFITYSIFFFQMLVDRGKKKKKENLCLDRFYSRKTRYSFFSILILLFCTLCSLSRSGMGCLFALTCFLTGTKLLPSIKVIYPCLYVTLRSLFRSSLSWSQIEFFMSLCFGGTKRKQSLPSSIGCGDEKYSWQ